MSQVSPEYFPLFTDAPSDDRNMNLGIKSPTLSLSLSPTMDYPLVKPNENILNMDFWITVDNIYNFLFSDTMIQ